ncbi:hypothetical protein HY229_02660 [Candidatus Acetothermia bacterium]|nr:hypothetical protein [Candidatus Acetothermia bacterium]MBI3642983.1 hypothetical protein [Candidatus Acetothermia bacterium]
METELLQETDQLSIEAEILRHIWYESTATPLQLSRELKHDLNVVYDCMDDLMDRGCIYQFWSSPQGLERSIYCLTRRVHRRLQDALKAYSRYRLREFWLSFNREDLTWLSNSFQN